MNGLKKLLLGFILICVVLALNRMSDGTTLVKATPLTTQPTITEIFPDRLEAHTFDSVSFTIHVTSNGIPVPDGLVTVREATDYFYAVSGDIVEGIVILEWVAQPWTPTGWCTFIASFEGTTGYEASSGTTEVSIASPPPTGAWDTETAITSDVSTAWIDSTINFSVSITILGGAFPFFSGGYISLVDITENIVLQRQDISDQAAVTYTATFMQVIPTWYSSGIHSFEVRYTGSSEADHAPSSGSCVIQVFVNGYSLSLNANATTINREDDSLLLSAYIEGDDPSGHQITLKSIQNDTQAQLDETNVTSRDYSYVFTPTYSHQLGPIDFEFTLRSPLTGIIEAQETLSALIIDNISIVYEFDAEEYTIGDTIHLIVYSVETDVPTQPVLTNVTVRDLSIPLELGPTTTDIYGRTEFEWQLSDGIAGGMHQIEIQATPLETWYSEEIVTTEITVRSDIEFILAYPSSVQRGEQAIFNCTIVYNSSFISEGYLNLRYQNDTLIWSTEVTGPLSYTYDVPLTQSIGPLGFLWEYEGSELFRPSNQSFTMSVFSEPHFGTLSANRTSVIPGMTIEVTGSLLDEKGQGIGNVSVTLWDNGQLFVTVSTMENGSFFYEYTVPNDATLGIHVLEVQFTGDYNFYLLPAANSGACTVTVRPPLQIILNSSLISTETSSIQVIGAPYEQVELAWSPLNSTPLQWYTINTLILDSNGQGNWDWNVPIFKGNISLRLMNIDNEMVFVEAIILSRAQVILNNLSNETQVQTTILFEGQVNEEFRILLDQAVLSGWQSAGTFQEVLSFQTRGLHTVTIQTRGEYVVAEDLSYPISVFEPLTATLDLPDSVSASSGITALVTIEGTHEGPISGMSVSLAANGTERAVSTTTIDGTASLTFSLSPGTYNISCETETADAYYQNVCISQNLLVRSTTQLMVASTDLYYYETCIVTAVLYDETNTPISNQYIEFLISADQGDIWSSLGINMTDSNGTSEVSWSNDLTSGIYLLKAEFTGSFYYDASLTTVEVMIQRNTIVASWESLSGVYGTEITLNVSLHTLSDVLISDSLNLSLTIVSEEQGYLVTTRDSNNSGFIIFSFILNFSPGNYTLLVTFDGNPNYMPGNWSNSLSILKIETVLQPTQVSYETTYGKPLNISLSVNTIDGIPVTDGEVKLSIIKDQTIYSERINTVVDTQVSFNSLINLPEGIYTLSFEYSGNDTVAASSTTEELIVNKGEATLNPIIESGVYTYGTTFSWTAYILDASGNPVSGVPVSFATSRTGLLWDTWGTIETNTSGYAVLELYWIQNPQLRYGVPGTYTLRVAMEENPFVLDRSETRLISIIKMDTTVLLQNCTVERLKTTMIQGTLTTSSGDPIENAPIPLFWTGTVSGAWEQLTIVSSDVSGNFVFEITISLIPYTYEIKAEYVGNDYYEGTSTISTLEVIDNPGQLLNVQISPSSLQLGESILIQVNAQDKDSISTVSAIIHQNQTDFSYTLPLINMNETFEGLLFCDAQFVLGSWTIDFVIIDALGLETRFVAQAQFKIITNPAPELNVHWDQLTLNDGETTNYTLTVSDSVGISNVSIVRENETVLIELVDNGTVSGQLQFLSPGTYFVQVIAKDNAGAVTVVDFTFEIIGNGPEFLNVYPSTTTVANLNTPVLLEVETIVTDPSGIATVTLYSNSTEYPLDFTNNLWSTKLELSEATYSLWLIASDIYGIESRYELGQINPSSNDITSSNNSGNHSENSSSTTDNNLSPLLLAGMLGLSLTVIFGSYILNWRRKNSL